MKCLLSLVTTFLLKINLSFWFFIWILFGKLIEIKGSGTLCIPRLYAQLHITLSVNSMASWAYILAVQGWLTCIQTCETRITLEVLGRSTLGLSGKIGTLLLLLTMHCGCFGESLGSEV